MDSGQEEGEEEKEGEEVEKEVEQRVASTTLMPDTPPVLVVKKKYPVVLLYVRGDLRAVEENVQILLYTGLLQAD